MPSAGADALALEPELLASIGRRAGGAGSAAAGLAARGGALTVRHGSCPGGMGDGERNGRGASRAKRSRPQGPIATAGRRDRGTCRVGATALQCASADDLLLGRSYETARQWRAADAAPRTARRPPRRPQLGPVSYTPSEQIRPRVRHRRVALHARGGRGGGRRRRRSVPRARDRHRRRTVAFDTQLQTAGLRHESTPLQALLPIGLALQAESLASFLPA
mmetsp:Transcript_69092/g.200042  ORF Transcript_69092/g.200042 Transcript_69092/m.200042 type:complete len:220 (+) Transcript_69092:358-1017(+)